MSESTSSSQESESRSQVPAAPSGTAGKSPASTQTRIGSRSRKTVLVGLCVSVVLGGAWAGLVILTNYQLGFVAWAMGIVVGSTLVTLAGRGSPRLGLSSVLVTFAGLMVAKALTYQFPLVPLYLSEIEDRAQALEYLATRPLRERLYLEDLNLLWVFLGLASAWQLGSGRKGG